MGPSVGWQLLLAQKIKLKACFSSEHNLNLNRIANFTFHFTLFFVKQQKKLCLKLISEVFNYFKETSLTSSLWMHLNGNQEHQHSSYRLYKLQVLMGLSLLPDALRPFEIYCASPSITSQLVLFLWQIVEIDPLGHESCCTPL